MIRLIRIVNVVLGTTPKTGDHRIQQPTLRGIGEDVLPESSFLGRGLLPQLLMTARLGTDPTAPIQAHETLQDSLHGLAFAILSGEFCNRADRRRS